MTDVIDVLNTQQPVDSDPLAALVGEGKKYRDVNELAKGRLEADRFIEQLKFEKQEVLKELAAAEAKATTQRTLQEVIDALNQSKGGEPPVNQTQVTPEDITRLVKQQVQEVEQVREQTNSRRSNRAKVNEAVLSRFDNDATSAAKYIGDRAKALGLSTEQVAELSETSPTAFIAMLGLNTPNSTPNTSAISRSNVNTAASAPVNSNERKLSYYQKVRKEMGAAKFFKNYQLQEQYRADMKRYGAAFNDVEPIQVNQ